MLHEIMSTEAYAQPLYTESHPAYKTHREDLPLRFGSNNAVNRGLGRRIAFGSSVAIHKLRDTKWFTHAESAVFCAVVESSFVVERKAACAADDDATHWGVALWKLGEEKSKRAENIQIINLMEVKGKGKIVRQSLAEFWTPDSLLRINNRCDKDRTPNVEAVVRAQIDTALKSSQLRWHNTQHFAYFCRYGSPRPQKNTRTKQISETLRWGNIGLHGGVFFLHQHKRAKAVTE